MAFYQLEPHVINIAGFTLNTEEIACLRSSLIVKKEEEKLDQIYLWGKLLGVQQDYFVAQSFSNEEYFKRKYFYTQDMSTWFELPVPTEQELEWVDSIHGRLTGNPSFEHTVPKKTGLEEEDIKVKEDVRIAGIVAIINRDVEIVPRKAYYRDAAMNIKKNPAFKGLSPDEIGLASSYFHFRPGFQLNSRTISERINTFDESIDVFETIERDEPNGCWSVQAENNHSVSLVRNLVWPGYTFVHSTCPVQFYGFYYGTGVKNHNIGYMI